MTNSTKPSHPPADSKSANHSKPTKPSRPAANASKPPPTNGTGSKQQATKNKSHVGPKENKSSRGGRKGNQRVNGDRGGEPPDLKTLSVKSRHATPSGESDDDSSRRSKNAKSHTTPLKHHDKNEAAHDKKGKMTPRLPKGANEDAIPNDKFSGSSFHSSPNAATLPRPPFSKLSPDVPKQEMTSNILSVSSPQQPVTAQQQPVSAQQQRVGVQQQQQQQPINTLGNPNQLGNANLFTNAHVNPHVSLGGYHANSQPHQQPQHVGGHIQYPQFATPPQHVPQPHVSHPPHAMQHAYGAPGMPHYLAQQGPPLHQNRMYMAPPPPPHFQHPGYHQMSASNPLTHPGMMPAMVPPMATRFGMGPPSLNFPYGQPMQQTRAE